MSTIHIALFKWKKEVSEVKVNEALGRVRELKNKVDGLINIYCGQNYHKENQGFTHGVVVIGKNKEALKNYRQHPDHEYIAPIIEEMEFDGIGFDFDDNNK